MPAAMEVNPGERLRSGYSTGACATAASLGACRALLTGIWSKTVTIRLPRGQTPTFGLEIAEFRDGCAVAGVRKDAGDDPDVTHDALICSSVRRGAPGSGIMFRAGVGVGTVTMAGLPVGVGEAAINPVPRRMMGDALRAAAAEANEPADFDVEISVPGGAEMALKTWNPRLGVLGGISILGTTGIVKPYSCSAWIASIHRGIDVARANGARHVVGSTGSTSEAAAQRHYGLPDYAMLDMGDFVGGLLKYLRRNPVPRLTIAGGFAKLAKLAHGATDLHSKRSRIDFTKLATLAAEACDAPVGIQQAIKRANTGLQALEIGGPALAAAIAREAQQNAVKLLNNSDVRVGVLVFDRGGTLVASDSDYERSNGTASP